ncbi:hypothetical protein BN874_160059 [Candidatus Contendobacter odensis Run_B_J11]|uniref:Uncharacterized protein n=1 Tax=Candidatus Contendobacter odensis Run_B_J11 TaxID=1400861 RepID=A0A7U7GAR7_9GAMM|nr:hypothetical protein BN874_160059 [Candidatus Contendobacter odensis Run_B_J11]
MSNRKDVTLDSRTATLCGYARQELTYCACRVPGSGERG